MEPKTEHGARPVDDPQYKLIIEQMKQGFLRIVDSPDVGNFRESPPLPLGTSPTYERFGEMLAILAQVYAVKNPRYGSAWCKDGELEAFFNVKRKFDRLREHLIVLKKSPDLLRPDDIADLANYGAMQLAYYLHHRPGQFREWAIKLLKDGDGL